ncbi:DUF177 domain-containing protein [Seohaeicola saemankumensis]|nr:DUF177 domain-containing protein [Seohaeicola saemankumensis]MCA0872846.1 DUF177 domain-containing protein [Seohaeicola saemankumensis]
MTGTTALRVADLAQNAPTPFDIRPDAAAMQALAAELDLSALRKLRFSGQIKAQGRKNWRLEGQLGATVVQPCVVTLEPVTTRIDVPVERTYVAGLEAPAETEAEMPEDDTVEPLGPVIDPATVLAEALALALPLYPRKDGAGLEEAVFTEPGKAPMRDEDARPFAGLSALRDQLGKKD